MRLTPRMLRDAAAMLSPTFVEQGDGQRFMCFAMSRARGREAMEKLKNLLTLHDVSLGGGLFHKGKSYSYHGMQRRTQKLRFDFLNLLACSLEK